MKSILRFTILLCLIISSTIYSETTEINKETFAKRRAALSEQISDGVLLLHGEVPKSRNSDNTFLFRQNSDFYYLTGLEEPNCIMLLAPGNEKEFVLFVPERNFFEILFGGEGTTINVAMEEYGADTAYFVQDFDKVLSQYMKGTKKLYYNMGNEKFNERFVNYHYGHRRGIPEQIENPEKIIHKMRTYKAEAEIAVMQKAIDITCESLAEVMRAAQPGMNEKELEGIIQYTWMKHGVVRDGFRSIIASGKNSSVLHYQDNNSDIGDNDLVMIDIGAEYNYYSADVTRTFPANGKFSKEQKEIYEAALASLKGGIELLKPGYTPKDVYNKTLSVAAEELYKLGLVTDVSKLWQVKVYYPYFFGHFLGMDTHDVGSHHEMSDFEYEPGMVIAIEPGIYVNPDNFEKLPGLRRYLHGVTEEEVEDFMTKVRPMIEKYAYICGRAEDDILITEDGNINLSEKLPKTVEEIEKLMQEETLYIKE